ncbi:hypothetical protein [Clostridium botulinum]|nr:hypothetical protein [Clostridium botulinum]
MSNKERAKKRTSCFSKGKEIGRELRKTIYLLCMEITWLGC